MKKFTVEFTKFSNIMPKTYTASKTFKTKREAIAWLQGHGFEAWGTRGHKLPSVFFNNSFEAVIL